jgi:glutamine amidotransferase
MQLLADHGTEGGENAGLGLIGGRIVHLNALGCAKRLPHMGWNDIRIVRPCELTENIGDGADFYFVHSYAFVPSDETTIVADSIHGVPFPAIVRSGNVFGAQFHPEKSSEAGFRILRNFIDYRPC